MASEEFNYGRIQLNKLDPEADHLRVKLASLYEDGREGAETHWMSLKPEQYAKVRELIISMNV